VEIAVETAHLQPFQTPGRRHVPRYAISVPVNVTVLRSGVPEGVPGRSVDVGEGGLCAVVASDLHPGELVGVEFRLPHLSLSVLAKARVSYQQPMRCGMQFLGLSHEQKEVIRYWAERTGQRRTMAEVVEAEEAAPLELEPAVVEAEPGHGLRLMPPTALEEIHEPGTRSGRWDRNAPWIAGVAIALLLSGMAWWHWEQGWQELEARVPDQRNSTRAPVKVPAEAMQRLLVHKVEPVNPEGAGPHAGVVVLDAVIASDGTVVALKRVKGPEDLGAAAIDAVRWWRFEPYRVDGQAVDVETELAVRFE
jgi:Gram-negative bacterial TonB protein C-terminal/PilZ domain